jgi:hypothetical protein
MHNTPNKPNRRPRLALLAAAALGLLAAVLIPAAIYAACSVNFVIYESVSITGLEGANDCVAKTEFVIMKAGLAIDKNRDRIIAFTEDDATSSSDKYRFWIKTGRR